MKRIATLAFLAFMVVMTSLSSLGLLSPRVVSAQVEVAQFDNAQQQSLYTDLLAELRCLVCANQSLSDSNADLAKDLRGKVQEMIARGQSREAIIDYMVTRYGEYILYRPRFSLATWFLWIGPLLLVIGSVVVVIVVVKKSQRQPKQQPKQYTAEQLQQAKSLLEEKTD